MKNYFKHSTALLALVICSYMYSAAQSVQIIDCAEEEQLTYKLVDSITKAKSIGGFAFSYTVLGLGDHSSNTFFVKNKKLFSLQHIFEDKVYIKSAYDTLHLTSRELATYLNLRPKQFAKFIDSMDKSRGLNHDHLMCFIAYKNGKKYEVKLYTQTQYLYNKDRGRLAKFITFLYDEY